MKRYNPKEIEPKWQQQWAEDKLYEAEASGDKPKKYVLEYFPYPSGAAMHVGHVRNYTIGDAVVRFNRMRGYNVLHPMGWDAFGLPAENYAIKTGISPQQTIKASTAKFKQQLTQMGFGYDWSREFASSDPDYYKWTQWFFLLLHKRGLAYRKESLQWWCPVDKTVLANEQVENGKCWRCGSVVEKKALPQWFFKITDYADRLAADLEDLNWSEGIKSMQRNWIGRSTGAEIDFLVQTRSNYVLLHGFTASSKNDFHEWTKQQLEKTGAHVYLPDLPNTEKPDAEEQAKFVLENTKFDENTVLLGHSYGSVTAMRILEQLDKPIKKLVLVAGFAQPGFSDGERIFESTTNWTFDFEKIRRNAGKVVILRDQADHAVPAERADFLQEKLGGEIVDFTAREPHVCAKVEPVVLQQIASGIRVFTTRSDTIFGATFMVLAPEHPLVKEITIDEQRDEVNSYIKQAQAKSDIERQDTEREKTGVFTGAYAVNPANGEKIPVWIADYVLYGYGTGAIMAVPAHDERDFAFAQRFKLLPLPPPQVVEPTNWRDLAVQRVPDDATGNEKLIGDSFVQDKGQSLDQAFEEAKRNFAFEVFSGEGVIKNSEPYDGMRSADVREKIIADLSKQGVAEERTNYKIRDWLISRQRYWGAPIPMIHCEQCSIVPVPEDQLPVELPAMESYEPSGDGRSPLARVSEWVNTTCPQCDGPAQRETDTMDGFACSSWYFLRFADPHNAGKPFNTKHVKYWLPVDDYIGGAEHAVMHLLYARFWVKVMYDEGLVDFQEPFKTLRNQGMILAPDGQKMSKSKGNTIEPDHLIEQGYGADAIRIMELFIGPWNQMANWSVEGMGGSYRFLQRVWTLTQEYMEQRGGEEATADDIELKRTMHQAIHRVSKDLEDMGFNTAIAALMETVNELYKLKTKLPFTEAPASWKWATETLLQLLAPFAPHITEELWAQLGHDTSIHISDWPVHDEQYLVSDTMAIVVQVNGKVRAQLEVPADAGEEAVVKAAEAHERIQIVLQGKSVKKRIYVPNKLVNFVA